MPLATDVALQEIAELSHGFVGADLEALCQEVGMIALRGFLANLPLGIDATASTELSALQVTRENFLAGLQAPLDLLLATPDIGGASLGTSQIGTTIVFVYIWLPYMVLPIQAALERVPKSLIEASSDLGAHPRDTFRRVILPLSIPGVAAGSIFTFSLTLGDYIIPNLVGSSRPFIGQLVYQYQGTASNLPLAAAFAVVPIVIMAVYLSIVKRFGAFDAL